MKFIGFILLTVLLATGCASTKTIESRRQEKSTAYQALNADMRAAVDRGQVKVGMPTDAVYIAWGKPSQVVTGGTETGELTTWIYNGGYVQTTRYWGAYGMHDLYTPLSYVRAQVIFADGVVKNWQTFPEPLN